ncbi:MAG: tyrosine-type recombinase/integrase [Balneolaceae bacterium]|nr:tyrosine-type recombinase/integrase [Balneolaceae bacterium]
MAKRKLTDAFIRSVNEPGEYYDEVVKGLCLRVTPRLAKSYSYEYNYNGKKKRKTFGQADNTSLKEARDQCRETKVLLINGIDPMEEIDHRKNKLSITVSDLAEMYIREHLPSLTEKTQIDYKRYLKKRILKKFGSREVNKINRREIIEFLDEIAFTEGYAVTSNRVLATLSGLFTFGLEKSIIQKDPTKNIKKKQEKAKERVFTNKEIKILWDYFSKMKMPTGNLYKIILLYARRKTETMKAEWSDINNGIWTIPGKNTKNNKDVILPITDLAQQIFNELEKYSGKSKYIFESPRIPNTHLQNDTNSRKRIQDKTDINDFTPHDLRRTAITKLAEIGTPEHIGKVIANHSQGDKNDVFKVYNRYKYAKEIKSYISMFHEHIHEII